MKPLVSLAVGDVVPLGDDARARMVALQRKNAIERMAVAIFIKLNENEIAEDRVPYWTDWAAVPDERKEVVRGFAAAAYDAL